MISRKISTTILYWLGIAVVCCIVMYVFMKMAYEGPPELLDELMRGVYKVIFIATSVLAIFLETMVRLTRRWK